ncbi:hypothetical protein F5J12DRAFT_842121 [Pisolithus orientalis]|uniref:uncharacterized protein n=1 Tax=Pisolithus orientalis TaxID=936130 RepID=UPI002225A90A|nr:uncharacterized protein F5J12DRAFT_842121 [Pisolithus orientalis]KAI6002276.1 hypothetical protein F5J12DRAFT_842121 [Pisolithus orientalis]
MTAEARPLFELFALYVTSFMTSVTMPSQSVNTGVLAELHTFLWISKKSPKDFNNIFNHQFWTRSLDRDYLINLGNSTTCVLYKRADIALSNAS